jgi:hypothetical protein
MTRKLACLTLLIFALALSSSAFAASKSESVTLYNDAQLNGQALRAGEYTVKCETTGSTAQVHFLKNGKEVASASGQVKQLTTRPEFPQVITTDSNGSSTISEIDFSHSGTGITFSNGAAMSSGGQ